MVLVNVKAPAFLVRKEGFLRLTFSLICTVEKRQIAARERTLNLTKPRQDIETMVWFSFFSGGLDRKRAYINPHLIPTAVKEKNYPSRYACKPLPRGLQLYTH